MDPKKGYEVVESGTRGKIVVATRDFLPGETVMAENEPVLFLSAEVQEEFKQHDPTDMHLFLAGFVVAMKRSDPVKKAKLLTLYGPTFGTSADNVRKYAKRISFSPNDETDPRPMTPEEVETFVHIASIMRLNMFGSDGGSKNVFMEVTRLAHSCAGNCSYHMHGKSIWCQTIRHVLAGEELTMSYMADRDLRPTHIHRQKYLEAKEFTCHCPRCDAPGDDTRQFDCVNPACKGVMMVCQPINKEEIRITNLPYTGVEYVEPHLLPCTKCHRAAPAAYQRTMLALEVSLPALVSDLVKRQVDLVTVPGPNRFDLLIKEIESLKLPMRHQLCMPIHNVLVKSTRFQFMDVVRGLKRGDLEQRRAAVHRAACAYIAAQEGVTPGANSNVASALYQVCFDCIMEFQVPGLDTYPYLFSPQQAKEMLQRLLRMKLILQSRTAPRIEEVDTALLKVLEGVLPCASTELCAFCEVSPLRAAISLSRCGKCKKVSYCSAGCQKAHWKLHKRSCKAEK